LTRGTPLRRTGTPEDIADVALFLVSEASRFITGEAIAVDGGLIQRV
jgi:NAD(P)-dependent dehydrogenase (short-subunit alcohol dehydrogenase family)